MHDTISVCVNQSMQISINHMDLPIFDMFYLKKYQFYMVKPNTYICRHIQKY